MVPVRKPHRQELVRVHPDESYRMNASVIELKDDREVYLVTSPIASQLPGETAGNSVHRSYPPGCRAAVASEAAER